ncbi:MAG: glycosyltransferase family 1 protein [Planctomycetia bacterium]|nr:glycosyltransferase family 1 protein [Planctomycetia bacterium]
MKLAICHPVVEPARGGCETYISMLLNRLCKDGHHVHLLASRWDSKTIPSRVQIRPIPDFSHPRSMRPWRFSSAVHRELKRESFDLSLGFDKVLGVDVLYPQGGVYAASAQHSRKRFAGEWKQTVVGWLRNFNPAHWSMDLFERYQYMHSPPPFVLAISDFTRTHLMRHHGLPATQINVLRSAIDPERLTATDRPARRVLSRQRWGIEPDDVFGIFLGVNPRLKGLGPLLDAIAVMPDRRRFRLGVFGVGEPTPYQRQAKQLGIEDCVRFVGYHSDIRDVYFSGDFLIHPTFYDPCSLVVLEAIAVGLPVITTRSNGAVELLDTPADSRVVDNPHNHKALATAMTEFLDNDQRRTAGRAAIRSAAKWTFDDHYRELLRLLELAHRRKRVA